MLAGSINKESPVPLYFQLKKILLDSILSGALQPGDCIPTEEEFSERFAISRSTVRQAMSELVNEGYLYRQKSKGTFVAKPKLSQKFATSIETYREEMKRLGVEPQTKVVRLRAAAATEAVAKQLELLPGRKVIELVRVRYANGDPIVVVDTFLPFDECAFLLEHDFTSESLYEVLAKDYQTAVVRVRRVIEAIPATQHDARLLNIDTGFAVQQFKTVGYSRANRPIEFSVARYRGDRNQFIVESHI